MNRFLAPTFRDPVFFHLRCVAWYFLLCVLGMCVVLSCNARFAYDHSLNPCNLDCPGDLPSKWRPDTPPQPTSVGNLSPRYERDTRKDSPHFQRIPVAATSPVRNTVSTSLLPRCLNVLVTGGDGPDKASFEKRRRLKGGGTERISIFRMHTGVSA